MNKVLKYLILSDILIWTGIGFATPVIAIFIKDRLTGGSLFTVGLATAIAYIVRAVLLVPLGEFNDRDRGNRREFLTLIAGVLIMALVPLSYIFIDHVYGFFMAQAVYGLGLALYYPGWYTIWTRFLDGFREGRTWSIYGAIISLSVALAALTGGSVAEFIGFDVVFALMAVFGVISVLFLIAVKKQIYEWPKSKGRGYHSGV